MLVRRLERHHMLQPSPLLMPQPTPFRGVAIVVCCSHSREPRTKELPESAPFLSSSINGRRDPIRPLYSACIMVLAGS